MSIGAARGMGRSGKRTVAMLLVRFALVALIASGSPGAEGAESAVKNPPATAAPAPQGLPSSTPSASASSGVSDPTHPVNEREQREFASRCEFIVKKWSSAHGSAQHALDQCLLNAFHTHCKRAAEMRLRVIAQDSPCMKIPAIRSHKFEEINCNIIQVPDHCGADESEKKRK